MTDVELSVRLKGKLAGSGQQGAIPHLVLRADGLFLCERATAPWETSIDVLSVRPLGYLSGTFSDDLRVGEHTYGIPAGKGDRVRRMIAYARIGPGRERVLPGREPFIEPAGAVEVRWLRAWLEPEELLLAWLALGKETTVSSPFGQDAKVTPRFLLTDRRAALAAVGPLGDAKVTDLPTAPLVVGEGRPRPVDVGRLRVHSTVSNGDAFAKLADLVGQPPAERVWSVARATRAEAALPRARRLEMLSYASAEIDAAAVLAALLRDDLEAPEALGRVLDDAEQFGAIHREWDLGDERAARLLDWARAIDERSDASVSLHVAVHTAHVGATKDSFVRAAHDLELAQHLLVAERWDEATALLEARLSSLPSEELSDLLPPADADLTSGVGGQAMRGAILDTLATSRGHGERDADTLVELARLQPLVPDRLRELAEAESSASTRVRSYRQALAERRWPAPAPAPTDRAFAPLSREIIEGVVRHPASRVGHALGVLQQMVAEVEVPDASALRAYCDTLGASRPDAEASVNAVSASLGTVGVRCFVSRGDKSRGLRSYEGEEPFVLVGCEHLDEASPHHLGPAELRFALAAELAHLRFGHSRVTSTDVWMGALQKTKGTFDAVVGFLPGWRALKVAEKASSIAGHYDKAEWAMGRLTKMTGWSPFEDKPRQERLGGQAQDLVAAARVMEFTADRVGLLYTDDLHAAIRAILLTGPDDGVDLLAAADERTMSAVLGARDEEGGVPRQSEAIRIAALVSFHLSPDWDRLRQALEES